MTNEELQQRHALLVKPQPKLLHVLSDGLLALMDLVEEEIPKTVGDELVLDVRMNALLVSVLAVSATMATNGGKQATLAEINDQLDISVDKLQSAIDDLVEISGASFTEPLPAERMVPYYERPEYSSKIERRPSPSIVIGNQDSEGNLIPQTDAIS